MSMSQPKISCAAGALTIAECRQILEANAIAHLPASTVRKPSGDAVAHGYRTSRSAKIDQPHAVLDRLRGRAAALVGLPVANLEPAELVAYFPGDHYGLHHDNPSPGPAADRMAASGGPRAASAVVALNEEYTGGGLEFPELGEHGWKTRPRLGHLYWWSNATRQTKHRALPVESGVRVVVVLFFREGRYRALAE